MCSVMACSYHRQSPSATAGMARRVMPVGADFVTLAEPLEFRIALFADTVVLMGHTPEPLTSGEESMVTD